MVNSAKRFSVDHEKVKGGHMAEFLATRNELQQSAATGTAKTPLSVLDLSSSESDHHSRWQ